MSKNKLGNILDGDGNYLKLPDIKDWVKTPTLENILEDYGYYCGDDCNGDFDIIQAKKAIHDLVGECVKDMKPCECGNPRCIGNTRVAGKLKHIRKALKARELL